MLIAKVGLLVLVVSILDTPTNYAEKYYACLICTCVYNGLPYESSTKPWRCSCKDKISKRFTVKDARTLEMNIPDDHYPLPRLEYLAWYM